jgi:PAS domain-containing protein
MPETHADAGAGTVLSIVDAIHVGFATLGQQEIATLMLTLGLIVFAVLAAIALVRTRKTAERVEAVSRHQAMERQAEIDRLKTLLLSEPQVLVAWAAATDETDILGDTGIIIPGNVPERVLAFGAWLEAPAAQRMEHAVETLRSEGRGFVMTLTTKLGRPIEAEGRAVAGRAVLRLRDVSGIERELIDLAARHDRLMSDVETMKGLLDSLPAPVWARDEKGRLVFVNQAYARAVEAADASDAVTREVELLDRAARDELGRSRTANELYSGRLPAIAAGERRTFDIVDAPSGAGSAGMAIDRTEVETMRTELARMVEAHRRVLDQLATGVAVFNIDRKLTFYNSAFRSLFELDAGLLDQTPTDTAVLDTLRTARKLPE